MSAAVYNIEAKQNNYFELSLTLEDNNNNPIDLTNYQGAYMQVRTSQNSSNEILDLSSKNGDIVLGGTNGSITIKISSKKLLSTQPIKNALYDLVLFDQNGEAWNILTGYFSINEGITRVTP